MNSYRRFIDPITTAFAELKRAVIDNPAQMQLIESSEPVVARRFAGANESMLPRAAGDPAGIAEVSASAEGHALMETVDAQFEQLAREEQRLLASRSARSETTGRLLPTIVLGCTALI